MSRPSDSPASPLIGRRYLLRGQSVTVILAWNGTRAGLPVPLPHVQTRRFAPRNVQIQWADGTSAIRPLRGLRVHPPSPLEPDHEDHP